MRKDYLPVNKLTAKKTEAKFVEDFWTKRWQKQALKWQAANIENEAEFKAVSRYFNQLPKGAGILYGGCGLGVWTRYFTDRGHKTVGLDISQKTITRLKRNFPKYKFVAGDIRRLPFKSGSFDAYFSWGTFEYFEEGLGLCFDEAYRVLKSGGLLLISVPYYNLRLRLKDSLVLPPEGKKIRFYQWRLTANELKREFYIHGFKVDTVRPIYKGHGLSRLVKHDLGVGRQSFLHKPLMALLYPFMPPGFVAHMLIAAAYKR